MRRHVAHSASSAGVRHREASIVTLGPPKQPHLHDQKSPLLVALCFFLNPCSPNEDARTRPFPVPWAKRYAIQDQFAIVSRTLSSCRPPSPSSISHLPGCRIAMTFPSEAAISGHRQKGPREDGNTFVPHANSSPSLPPYRTWSFFLYHVRLSVCTDEPPASIFTGQLARPRSAPRGTMVLSHQHPSSGTGGAKLVTQDKGIKKKKGRGPSLNPAPWRINA